MSRSFDAAGVVRRLGAVPEPAMRRAIWREQFAGAEPEELLELVDRVLREVRLRRPDARVAYAALIAHLETADERSYSPRRALYEAARAADNEAVMQLLRSAPEGPTTDPSDIVSLPLDRDRDVTLGERRALARRPDREMIERLLSDPDPGVIANLLNNPKLTEADVLRIATRRPLPADVLTLIFRHGRWGLRPEVRGALVYNPYTPVDTAIGLLPLLDWAQVVELRRDPAAHPSIRERARALVAAREAERGRAPGAEGDDDPSA